MLRRESDNQRASTGEERVGPAEKGASLLLRHIGEGCSNFALGTGVKLLS
jgi:hypothetical protein